MMPPPEPEQRWLAWRVDGPAAAKQVAFVGKTVKTQN
jgi:hypothetical protein